MKKGLLTSLFIFLSLTTIFAQSSDNWKYEAYPDLPFQLNNIDLEISVEPESALIKATGMYNIRSRRPDLTEVIFNTSNLDIKEVSSNGQALEFRVSSDSLIIQLSDTLGIEQSTEFLISWESSSVYGIHTDVHGNLWTSLNPRTRHHWLPIPDHPEVETTVNASFTIPAEQEAVFNGTRNADEVVSTDEKKITWNSGTEVPVSGITFAVGNFQRESARSGVKEVSIYASDNTLLEDVRSGLLATAVESLKKYEADFSFEFPFDGLSIVVLPDNKWEEIQSGAGVIYLYQNLGNLTTQLKRGIVEQWLGNYHRYLNAPDSRYEFLKALVMEDDETEQLLNPDDLQSIREWNKWEQGIGNMENEFLKATIRESMPELIQEIKGVTSWDKYADFWYDQTGTFWNKLPEPSDAGQFNETEEAYAYSVKYIYDEVNSVLSLVFEAQSQPIGSLVGIDLMQYGFTDTTQTEISFTGARDSVSVELPSGTDYVTLTPKTDLNLKLNEEKPFIFLIRQLRSSDPDEKIQAAEQLRNYTDNPDLQLALQDVLEVETEPEVRAAMLATLGQITKGASGTEQNFLGQLNSDNLATQLSAIKALAGYPDNEQVRYAIRNTIIRSERDTVTNAALNTYRQIASAEDLISLTERLERSGEAEKAINVLQLAVQADTTKQSISIADRFALGEYPFDVRKKALDILLKFEQNQDYWNQTIGMLLGDRDPRVRYHALNAIKYLSAKRTVDVLKDLMKEEMDPRVAQKIRRIM
ncbi:hypothetical protein [Gracilimonas sp.]|uniref:hypothetical protein n=1 Tax=Gracilimonas sp. TaxID=1974203 RepID=UPI0032ECEE0A